ncbi:hypothetical protein ASPWEDRAFT_542480 [Aspergillus wentii DTO 134E9]|uniref:Uncharacterized protein n=1 Tax=Aspergillus wentii DTO 134E9 TaxID=1073089 RepID=A0A1L9RFQ4_ASPWE|nr:uncharacterized protein ASPWEDRAFT_542480 [Aspergillus wentii DTO 134E9]OJJ33756.1 hypothetical protein ASPWEDRAFT_542480 [Aspergillus wentii DTO 134E9]
MMIIMTGKEGFEEGLSHSRQMRLVDDDDDAGDGGRRWYGSGGEAERIVPPWFLQCCWIVGSTAADASLEERGNSRQESLILMDKAAIGSIPGRWKDAWIGSLNLSPVLADQSKIYRFATVTTDNIAKFVLLATALLEFYSTCSCKGTCFYIRPR